MQHADHSQTQNAFYGLDPTNAAKQMAALSSAGKARRAAQGPSDDASLSPNVSFATISSYQPPTMQSPVPPNPQQQQQQQAHMRARHNFYASLANVMATKGTPLPPAITGIHTPTYDPSSSGWKSLEPSAPEPGGFRLHNINVDLHRLWSIVLSVGGSMKMQQSDGWARVAQMFDLPPEIPHSTHPTGLISSALLLSNYYKLILGPYEEVYVRSVKQQQALHQAKSQGAMNPSYANSNPVAAHSSTVPSASQMFNAGVANPAHQGDSPQRQTSLGAPPSVTSTSFPVTDDPTKSRSRVVQDLRLGSALDDSDQLATVASSKSTRQKIEYIPVARELETYGGRDLNAIESELAKVYARRPPPTVDEWGQIDVEGLMMSLRSRLPAEVSYCLGTLTFLSTMRGVTPASGFPLVHCEDLLDEILDYLNEVAFGEQNIQDDPESLMESLTGKGLQELALEQENGPFAPENLLHKRRSPMQSKAQHILAVTSLLRNLAVTQENQLFLGKNPRVVKELLRVVALRGNTPISSPQPLSPALSLRDLVQARRDVLHILLNIISHADVSLLDEITVQRLFNASAVHLIDPGEAVPPTSYVVWIGGSPQISAPPLSADLALELLTKLAQPDSSRREIAKVVTPEDQWAVIEALVHRLPISDLDFKIAMHESWYPYIERIIFSLYCLAFIASPQMKQKIKMTRGLGFTPICLRIVKRYTISLAPEFRQLFSIPVRRLIETMKLIDEGGNSFDTPQAVMPTVAFGMGYGEQGNSKEEVGMGLLGGYQEDVTWGIMRLNALEPNIFSEIESLARVG